MSEKGLPHMRRDRAVIDPGQQIVVATDLGAVSEQVEARAMQIAEERGASLTVVAVVAAGTETDASTRMRVDDLVSRAQERGIEAHARIYAGDPVDALLDATAAEGATGIVVGDDQWSGLMPHPCLCAPLLRLARMPVIVLHRSPDHSCELPV